MLTGTFLAAIFPALYKGKTCLEETTTANGDIGSDHTVDRVPYYATPITSPGNGSKRSTRRLTHWHDSELLAYGC